MLDEITPSDIDGWAATPSFIHEHRTVDEVTCEVELVSGEKFAVSAMECKFRHPHVTDLFPAVIFVQFADLQDPGSIWKSPIAGPPADQELRFEGQSPNLVPVPLGTPRRDGGLEILVGDDEYAAVETLYLKLRARLVVKAIGGEGGRHFNYSSAEGPIATLSRFDEEIEGNPVQIEALRTPDGKMTAEVIHSGGFRAKGMPLVPIVTDMSVFDTSIFHMLPLTIQIAGGEPVDGVILEPREAFFEGTVDIRAFDADNFIFVDRASLQELKRTKRRKGPFDLSEMMYVVPRNIVQSIDLGPAINYFAERDRKKQKKGLRKPSGNRSHRRVR